MLENGDLAVAGALAAVGGPEEPDVRYSIGIIGPLQKALTKAFASTELFF
jgi:hypothetical protein